MLEIGNWIFTAHQHWGVLYGAEIEDPGPAITGLALPKPEGTPRDLYPVCFHRQLHTAPAFLTQSGVTAG